MKDRPTNFTFSPRPKILCLGDSITEYGNKILLQDNDLVGLNKHNIGWTILLSSMYTRRMDVINRGLSGYNTSQARFFIPHILEELKYQNIEFLIMCFGANDSALQDGPASSKYVSVSEYKANLKQIHQMFRNQYPHIQTIIITPPPTARTDERNNDNTLIYAQASFEVGKDLDVPVGNIYHEIQDYPNWRKNCLTDGLHLTSKGNEIFYECVQEILSQKCRIDTIPLHFPDHIQFNSGVQKENELK